jgi:antitoxin component YwqK of YwqJK toxin-antitoxin module
MKILLILILSITFTTSYSQVTKVNVGITYEPGKTVLNIADKDTVYLEYNPHCSMDHGFYLKSKLPDGEYLVFYNDTLGYKGSYKKNLMDGTWIHYNKDGSILYTEKFKQGVLIKE